MKKQLKKCNKNGANQWKPDPRQSLFLKNYLDPKSETFSNCLQSALRAGYEEQYARVLVSQMPAWLSENLNNSDLLAKAEENLKYFLEMEDEKEIKVKADITKFVAERLGKKKWSQKTEAVVENKSKVILLDM